MVTTLSRQVLLYSNITITVQRQLIAVLLRHRYGAITALLLCYYGGDYTVVLIGYYRIVSRTE